MRFAVCDKVMQKSQNSKINMSAYARSADEV